MPQATLIPVEEYLTTSYRPDCDYVDGVLVERNVGQYDHSRLQHLLSRYLGNREQEWGVRVLIEQRVQVRPTRYRVPDICVISRDAPIEQILTHPPFLCIEIVSPDDRMDEVQERIDDYLAFGVACVWLLNPRNRRAFIYTAAEIREVKDGILRTSDPDLAVPVAELFD